MVPTGSRPMRLIALTLSAAAVLLVGAACGIDTVEILSNPPVSDGPGLVHAPDVIETAYLGVDLFYRIYYTVAEAQSAASAFLAQQDMPGNLPGESIVTYLLSDSQLRYKRLIIPTSIMFPVLSKDILLSKIARLDFNTAGDATLFLDNTFYGYIKRNLSASGISFSVKPLPGDFDLQNSSATDDDPDLFHIQIFAASYGLSDTSQDLYSDAISLGIVDISY